MSVARAAASTAASSKDEKNPGAQPPVTLDANTLQELFDAVEKDDFAVVKKILEANPQVDINTLKSPKTQESLMKLALISAGVEIFSYLVETRKGVFGNSILFECATLRVYPDVLLKYLTHPGKKLYRLSSDNDIAHFHA